MPHDYITQFANFCAERGYAIMDSIAPDDKIHRVRVNDEKRSSASYQLKIDGDFAVGWVRSFKEGVTHKFHSSNGEKLSKEQREKLNARLKLEREQKDLERKKASAKAQSRAKEYIDKSSRAKSDHPYLQKKQVEPLGIRQLNDRLIIPVIGEKGVKSLQWIDRDGGKRFLSGGEIKGGYCLIVFKQDSLDKIVICEGWATGASIRMATGLPVIVAFNAGNLAEVAHGVRAKHPETEIVIAADNDAFTETGNIGREKGQKAAKIVNALYCEPSFLNDDTKPTDFNDLHVLDGLEKVREQIEAAQPLETHDAPDAPALSEESPHDFDIPMDAYADDLSRDYDPETAAVVALYESHEKNAPDKNWREHLQVNDKNMLKPKSLTNVAMILENDDRYKNLFCYDEFSKEKMLVSCPPWCDPAEFKVRPIIDEDKTRLTIDLEIKRGLDPAKDCLRSALDSVVLKKTRNPAQEYFNTIEWDGTPRLDTWLSYYMGCEEDDSEYLRLVGTKWLVAAVARVFTPGCKFDHMLILEGDQGTAKSFALKTLATIHGNSYFDDTLKVTDLGSKDGVMKLQGILICELAEMSGMRRKDVSELKQDITSTHDRIVLKYRNEPTVYPRQFVFAGTINPIKGYLSDASGERRFWPVKIGRVDIESLTRDREQLWAEAVALYRDGLRTWVSEEEKPLFDFAQRLRMAEDPWQVLIEPVIAHLDFIRRSDMDEIWRAIGVERSKRDTYADDRINRCLSALGFAYMRKQMNGTRQYMWVKK